MFDIQTLHSSEELVSICRGSEEKGSPTEYAFLDILAEIDLKLLPPVWCRTKGLSRLFSPSLVVGIET